mgnify:CR=1 FL=1
MEHVLSMAVLKDNVVHNMDSNEFLRFYFDVCMCTINLVVVLHKNIVKELYDKVIVKLKVVLTVYVVRNLDSVVILLNIAIKHQ